MGIPVLIEGRSGSGKTFSIKTMNPESVGIFSVEKGRLPFKGDFKVAKIKRAFKQDNGVIVTNSAVINYLKYNWIETSMLNSDRKSFVIDDSQYLLVNEMFDRASENGYNKFTDMAKNFRGLVHFINESLPNDVIVYFLHHTETGIDGREKCKTIGKMLDEKLVLEGMFDVVIYCHDHKFYTQGNETSTAKTPEGMFDELIIENDMKAVDDAIRAYWSLG